MRKISAMIEWRSGLDGLSGLILLLYLMVLWSLDCGRKLKEIHADMGRMCKLHTDSDLRPELNPGLWCCEAAVVLTAGIRAQGFIGVQSEQPDQKDLSKKKSEPSA